MPTPRPARPGLKKELPAALARAAQAHPDKRIARCLRRFAATLPDDEHAVMALDGAGWRISNALAVPSNVTPLRLPPYSPELNPVERLWLHLRERHLSYRVHEDYAAILDAVGHAIAG